MTRLPISACWMTALAPTKQSRPIATASPMTAPAETMVPRPISARAPTTAPGSTRTPSSSCASGCTVPPSSPRPKKPGRPQRRRIGAGEIEAVGAIGLRRLQHGDVLRHAIGIALLAEAGRRARRGEMLHVFRIVEEAELALAAVSSGAAPSISRIGIAAHEPRPDQLRDLRKTQRSAAPERSGCHA